eukprot:SAG31_NODE_2816_length_5044_cov_8.297674_2_plen_112_part_00
MAAQSKLEPCGEGYAFIELCTPARPKSMQYKTPMHLLPKLKKWIQQLQQEMLDKNFIRRSDSTVIAPILVLKKPGLNKDGTSRGYRFVSDLRANLFGGIFATLSNEVVSQK